MTRHHAKSGTRSPKKDRGSKAPRTALPVSFEVRQKVERTVVRLGTLSAYSELSLNTAEQMFLELIDEHGAESCLAVVNETVMRDDLVRINQLVLAAFRALARRRKIREAKLLMARVRMRRDVRIKIWSSMTQAASPDDQAELIAEVHALMAKIDDPCGLFDAHYWLYLATKNEVSSAYLTAHCKDRLSMEREVLYSDIEVLLGIAQIVQSLPLTAQVLTLLERGCSDSLRQTGEILLRRDLMRWSRQRLLALADFIKGTYYESEIRRLAGQARLE